MNILILNPNSSEAFTSSIQSTADQLKGPETKVEAINPPSGPNTLDCTYDILLCAQPSLETIINNQDRFDGFIIACFTDHPVIYAAREITSKPVIGIMEAALYVACMLGRSFSIVTPPDRLKGLLLDGLDKYGLTKRCASVRTLGMAVADLKSASPDVVRSRIEEKAREAIEEDGAEVIVLGCGGFAGLDKELQHKLGVPVIEGVSAALKIMEALLGYGVTTSKNLTYSQPDPKPLRGLPDIFSTMYGKK
jgi:allantoin racemase